MKQINNHLVRPISTIYIIAIMSFSPIAKAAIHVSPTGSDANPGTREKPLQTLSAAQQHIRHLPDGTAREVVLGSGVYRLDDTFALNASDSGTTYRAAPNEIPRISGGMEVPLSRADGDRQLIGGVAKLWVVER